MWGGASSGSWRALKNLLAAVTGATLVNHRETGSTKTQTLAAIAGRVKYLSAYTTVAEALAAMATDETLVVDAITTSFDGVIFNKRIRVVGAGREQCSVTGTWGFDNSAAGITFEDIHFKTPTTTYMIDIVGGGYPDFKRCTLSAGAGNFVFRWNNSGASVGAIELIQCYLLSGKLLDCSAGGVTTFEVHAKETCILNFTENNQLVTSGSNYAKLTTYHSLLNVSSGVTIFGTTGRVLNVSRQCVIDDQSTGMVFLKNGSGVFDTFDFAGVLVSRTNGSTKRFVELPSSFGGSGVTGASAPLVAALATGGLTINGDHHRDYVVLTGSPSLTANVTYSISGGLYEGQRIKVYFVGTHTLNGFVLNLFGLSISTNSATVEPCAFELVYVNGAWSVFAFGKNGAALVASGEQAALPDTSGATLAALETEVNAIKARLRSFNVMAS